MRFPIFVLIASAAFAQDANEIMRRATGRDFTNFENRKNYTYQERTEVRMYDGKGKLAKTEVETHEILILEGQPYERLIARNDKPLSEKDVEKEQKKLDKEVEKRRRQSASEKAKLDKGASRREKIPARVHRSLRFPGDWRGAGKRQAGVDPLGDAEAWLSSEGLPGEDVRQTARQGLDR